MNSDADQFSFRERQQSLARFKTEQFDVLVIGGGITGAAVARDAVMRGLKVALVEKKDFAFGTSSRSSKLIHGGLRYLQNMELGLVFESLSERALLLKTVPHMVRPLPFYLPVYEDDPRGQTLLSMGLWLYDLLSLFRTPGVHKRLSKKEFLKDLPFLKGEGLKGGFRYYDASMWDDVLAIQVLRDAQRRGAAIANYIEAKEPLWENDQIVGFKVQDQEEYSFKNMNTAHAEKVWSLRAHKTVICAGPWTDQIGIKLSHKWKNWLNPSQGIHLVFDLAKIPIPGAMVMSNPDDGRVSFVMGRPDYGPGVTIVGTTDAPVNANPEDAQVTQDEVQYLMDLLNKYFPQLNLTSSDIVSAYIGVRPLMGDQASGGANTSEGLQKVSREHFIDRGPAGTVVVAGGKYTTHRKMAEEIVEFTLKCWKEDHSHRIGPSFPKGLIRPNTKTPINPYATLESLASYREQQKDGGESFQIPQELYERYGAESSQILSIDQERIRNQRNLGSLDPRDKKADPEGFPFLEAQLIHLMRTEMVMHLEDFYLRRLPLFMTRKDGGMPWKDKLAEVWAQELGVGEAEKKAELERLEKELARRSAWKSKAVTKQTLEVV